MTLAGTTSRIRDRLPDQLSYATPLVCNLLGAFLFAVLIRQLGVLDQEPARQLVDLAQHKVDYGLRTAFVRAIFAGWLMTMLTWLLVAAEGFGPRLTIIWMLGTLIVLGQFNHVVISASEIFMAMLLDAPITVGDWLTGNFLPVLAGNIVGGVVFVTLLHRVQAQYDDASAQPRHRDQPSD